MRQGRKDKETKMKLDYDSKFFMDNMMGPNAVRILDELCEYFTLKRGARILDLGCGKGLTSIYLAERFEAQMFATDLWISATENYGRFEEAGMEKQIVPIHADACGLPYAQRYFDAVVSVDSYHYFGTGAEFMDRSVAPLVKEGGVIAVAVPGLKKEPDGGIPDELRPFWEDEMTLAFHSPGWWKALWEKAERIGELRCVSMGSHAQAWKDWLKCDNPYARHDVEMMAAEGGNYFDTIGLVAKVK